MNLTYYKQKKTESIDEFYTRCRALALKCKFKDIEERLIDQLITGTRVNESRKELLKQDEKLKVEDALQICRTHEASEAHMHAFEQAGAANANKIDFIGKRQNEKRPNQVTNCKFCAKDHAYGRCQAYYDTCEQCGLVGHWKVRCSHLKKQRTQQLGRNYSKGQDRA